MDNKFIPFNHPMFNQTADGKGEPYVHQIRGADNLIGPPFEILSDKAVKAEGSSQHSTSDWCKTGGDNAYTSYPVTCGAYAIQCAGA